jgi:hypothetical protein
MGNRIFTLNPRAASNDSKSVIEWRGDKDSNPRNALTFNGFQGSRESHFFKMLAEKFPLKIVNNDRIWESLNFCLRLLQPHRQLFGHFDTVVYQPLADQAPRS